MTMKTKLLLMRMKLMMVTLLDKRLDLKPIHMLMKNTPKRHLVGSHARTQLAIVSLPFVCTTVLHFGKKIDLSVLQQIGND